MGIKFVCLFKKRRSGSETCFKGGVLKLVGAHSRLKPVSAARTWSETLCVSSSRESGRERKERYKREGKERELRETEAREKRETEKRQRE